jgi:hypothetical protein
MGPKANWGFGRKCAAAATLLLVACSGYLSAILSAQSVPASLAPPNLSGVWNRKGPIPGRPPNVSPVTLARARAIGFSMAFDEVLLPSYDCSPVSVPVILNDNYNFEITQMPDRVILRHEKEDVVRTVWLEGHGHRSPGVYEFSLHGYSTGRYENNQLVIETTKFVFDPRGFHDSYIPSSTQKKVTERYWRQGNLLMMESVSEDPLILKQPFHYHFQWELTQRPLTPYNCEAEDSAFARKLFETKKYQDPDWIHLRLPQYVGGVAPGVAP